MAGVIISGDTSGSVTLQAPAVAGTVTVTLPSASGTMAVSGASPSFTTITTTSDASISGLTVGKGGSAVSTNTALGVSALASVPSASYIYNTAIGYQALTALNGGSQNTACGYTAMAATTSGGANASFGDLSLKSNTTGSYNSALGSEALTANTTGSYNVGIGQKALQANTTASDNTCVGYTAGNNITTGATNTCVGRNAIPSGATTSNETVVGGGFPFQGKGANTGYFGGSSGAYNQANSSSWSTTSDFRLKKNIVDNTEGLDIISQIRVRNFEYKTAEEVTELPAHTVIDKQGVQLGVVAQELQAVCSDCVKEESTGVLSVDTSNLTWHMINAIKDLKAELDTVKAELAALKG